jgi:hypothetical protein
MSEPAASRLSPSEAPCSRSRSSPSVASISGKGSSPGDGAVAARKVATSMISRPKNTWASRKRRPTRRQLRNSFRTCSGSASVATSKSFGSMPISRSRTQPPTRNAMNPASRRRYRTLKALGEMCCREMMCSDRVIIRGVEVGVTTDAENAFK